MELLLIRHALPIRVKSQDGTPADPPLSPLGHRQADALARWLADEHIDALYSSPMQRAVETSKPLAAARGLPVAVEPRVAEFDRDADQYIPMEELKATDYEAWKRFVQGGYEDGHDLEQFRRDVVAGLETIIDAHPGQRVAVVCHGGVINAWAVHLLALDQALFFGPDYTSINRFMAASSGERSIQSLNETPHLRSLRST